MMKLDFIFTP